MSHIDFVVFIKIIVLDMGAKDSNLCVDTNFSKKKLNYEDWQLKYTVCHMQGNCLFIKVTIYSNRLERLHGGRRYSYQQLSH